MYSTAIQSTSDSGLLGDFLYEIETGKTVSPVFDDLIPLFKWIKENGFVGIPGTWNYQDTKEL